MKCMSAMRIIVLAAAAGALAGCAQGPPQPVWTSLATEVQTERWASSFAVGVQQTTHNYCIYSTAHRTVLRKYMPGFMEMAHQNYLALTGLPNLPAAEPMPIYMLGTRREWAALTKHVVRHHTELYLAIEAGGYCYRGVCVFWDIGVATLPVAAHEGLHQFFHHNMKNHLPMWLEEGLCVTAEGFELNDDMVVFTPDKNVARFTDLQRAITRGDWIPLDELLPMDAGDAIERHRFHSVGYYGQLWALVQFIRSQPAYKAGMERMLRDAQAGRFAQTIGPRYTRLRGRMYNRLISERLFRHYITKDLKTFDSRFYAFAKKLVKLE